MDTAHARAIYEARTAGDSQAITALAAGGGPREPRNVYEDFCRTAARTGRDWQHLDPTLRRTLVACWCDEHDDEALNDYIGEATAHLELRAVRPLLFGLVHGRDRGAFAQLFATALTDALRDVICKDIESWRS